MAIIEKPWIYYEGRSKRLNEVDLAHHLITKHNLHYVGSDFLDAFGDIETTKVEREVFKEIASEFPSPMTKITNVIKLLKGLAAYDVTASDEDALYTKDGCFRLGKRGLVADDLDTFTLLRFNQRRIEEHKDPEMWLAFLRGIFHEDDIKVLQEFLGYCLLPTTRSQEALVIIGKGGEGKSVIGRVIKHIWGNKAIMDKIQNLDEDRFLLSRLVNKLVFIDDDLDPKKLERTGIFKQLVTNGTEILVEDKYMAKKPAQIYTRFIMFGNSALQSLYDRSDGFFRRLKIIRCKPVKNREADMGFFNKLLPEMENIFNWCVDGLLRLNENNFCISETTGSAEEKADMKSESMNVFDFMESSAVEMHTNYATPTKRLFECYEQWCEDNGTTPVNIRSFVSFLRDHKDTFCLKYDKNLSGVNGKLVRGFKGVKVKYV